MNSPITLYHMTETEWK